MSDQIKDLKLEIQRLNEQNLALTTRNEELEKAIRKPRKLDQAEDETLGLLENINKFFGDYDTAIIKAINSLVARQVLNGNKLTHTEMVGLYDMLHLVNFILDLKSTLECIDHEKVASQDNCHSIFFIPQTV